MKYYVYGGAFNPPTIAHQQITEKLVSYAGGSSSGVVLMKEKWVHDEFVRVFGSDSFNSMPNWDHGK